MKYLLLLVLIIIVIVAIALIPRRIKGGSEQTYPLVFVSSAKKFSLKNPNPKKWKLITQTTEPQTNKKIRESIYKKPTLVTGTRLREDVIYDKPDLHIHLSPVMWDLSNPSQLAQQKQNFVYNNVDFDSYWDTLGHQDINLLIQSPLGSVSQTAKTEIKKALEEQLTIKAGLFVPISHI